MRIDVAEHVDHVAAPEREVLAAVVGMLDGDPVAIGGWRHLRPGVAEIKRMYVVKRARGLGLARRMLAALESAVATRGFAQVVLMTGRPDLIHNEILTEGVTVHSLQLWGNLPAADK